MFLERDKKKQTTFEDMVTVLEYKFVLALWKNDPQMWAILDRWGRRKPTR